MIPKGRFKIQEEIINKQMGKHIDNSQKTLFLIKSKIYVVREDVIEYQQNCM